MSRFYRARAGFFGVSALVAWMCGVLVTAPVHAQQTGPTPAEAYADGCGGCHPRERTVLRAIPAGSEAERRAWIENFMRQHPCEHDDLKPKIIDYLLEKTRR